MLLKHGRGKCCGSYLCFITIRGALCGVFWKAVGRGEDQNGLRLPGGLSPLRLQIVVWNMFDAWYRCGRRNWDILRQRFRRLSRWLKHRSNFVQSLQGMIRAAVGQGRQILAERFPQFRDLVSFASREVSLQFAGDCLGGKVCQWGRFAQGVGVWPTGFLGDDWYTGI